MQVQVLHHHNKNVLLPEIFFYDKGFFVSISVIAMELSSQLDSMLSIMGVSYVGLFLDFEMKGF